MSYKILYIEDLDGDSVKNNLERCDIEVIINNASGFDETLNDIEKTFDAYIMDFRLDAKTGRVNAPTFASTIRGFAKDKHQCPIILVSNEVNLVQYDKDFTCHDLFDMVIRKDAFLQHYLKYCDRIKDSIEAYKHIKGNDFDINSTLDINNEEDYILDYRLISKLNDAKKNKDIYSFYRTIYQTLIRGIGLLIGEDILAARFGVDKGSENYSDFISIFDDCKYTGIMSSSYHRWWAHRVIAKWKEIADFSLRRLQAADRVEILRKHFALSLRPAEPLDMATSTTFWTICAVTKRPLDPSEGFIFREKDLEVWQEQEYISLYSALTNPKLRKFLSPGDKKELLQYE